MPKQVSSAKKKATNAALKKAKDYVLKRTTTADQKWASWTVYEKFGLLDLYLKVREDPSAAMENGLKSKAWTDHTVALNTKHKRTVEKRELACLYNRFRTCSSHLSLFAYAGQCKSKLDRIMRGHDLFKEIKGLSGVGVCFRTGMFSFPDYSNVLVSLIQIHRFSQ